MCVWFQFLVAVASCLRHTKVRYPQTFWNAQKCSLSRNPIRPSGMWDKEELISDRLHSTVLSITDGYYHRAGPANSHPHLQFSIPVLFEMRRAGDAVHSKVPRTAHTTARGHYKHRETPRAAFVWTLVISQCSHLFVIGINGMALRRSQACLKVVSSQMYMFNDWIWGQGSIPSGVGWGF